MFLFYKNSLKFYLGEGIKTGARHFEKGKTGMGLFHIKIQPSPQYRLHVLNTNIRHQKPKKQASGGGENRGKNKDRGEISGRKRHGGAHTH